MNTNIIKTDEYKRFIQDIKQRIQTVQIKAAIAVNRELLRLYWDMAERIVEKQKQAAWGDRFIKQMSVDLQADFPNMKGFSERNIKYIRQWYLFYNQKSIIEKQAVSDSETKIGQQVVAQIMQIPWGHNIVIISKCKNIAVDSQYRQEEDQPTIGILLCKSKDKLVVEYALSDINKPIGVSEYQLTNILPDNLKSNLPSIEELERKLAELGKRDEW